MKTTILFFFLSTGLLFSQTQEERNFIISQSNPEAVAKLKEEGMKSFLEQQKLIADYLLKHPEVKNKANLQRVIDGVPYFYQEDSNALCVQTLRANAMYPSGSLGLSVTGSGMTVGMWDGGKVRNTHVEFGGRVTLADGAATLSTHSTHVLGTIIAAGVSPTRKGFAYQALATAYDYNGDNNEIIGFANLGYLVSNHSYGNIADGLPEETFGAYNSQSVQADNIMFTYPFFQMVKSAGNDRSDMTLDQVMGKGGYDLLTGAGTAKNVITVAAVEGIMTNGDDNSFVMSTFSNFGPPDDGRVKPDISAKGVEVSSPISVSDNAYSELQGTSMAAPCITGLITLLQKHFNNMNPGTYMRSASVRGLLFQTAREAGPSDGPDYMFGWGLADGTAAANIITNRNVSTILDELTLNNSQVYTRDIVVSAAQNLNVVISWTDPIGPLNTGIDERTPRLKNNLDLKILKDGTTYYPWKLDPEMAEEPATNTSDNDVDNTEKVEIPNAQPGVYTIQVTHKGSLQDGSQAYSLIASGSVGLNLSNEDYVYDNSVFIYPNPANNVLNFEIKNNAMLTAVNIHDISGKEVYRNTNPGTTTSVDVANLSSGVYFVTFKSDRNSVTKKFIKE